MHTGGGDFAILYDRKKEDRIGHEGRVLIHQGLSGAVLPIYKEESFTWFGEVSREGGVTRELAQGMFGERMSNR